MERQGAVLVLPEWVCANSVGRIWAFAVCSGKQINDKTLHLFLSWVSSRQNLIGRPGPTKNSTKVMVRWRCNPSRIQCTKWLSKDRRRWTEMQQVDRYGFRVFGMSLTETWKGTNRPLVSAGLWEQYAGDLRSVRSQMVTRKSWELGTGAVLLIQVPFLRLSRAT